VLLALTPIAERAIEQLLFGENPPVAPVASVGEADELEAAAQEQTAIAVLISPQLSGLSTGHCERVRAAGLRLVGVALDQHDEQALQAFAPDAITTPDEGGSELLAKINGTAEHRTSPKPHRPAKRSAVARRAGAGTALAVVGARGAGGASECAASLASLSVSRWPTVLVELDALGGSLAVRLGSDPHEGSVLGLMRAAEAGEEVVPELLERWLTAAPGWPPLLLGPARADPALTELASPGAVATALDALRSTFPLSVWDVGSLLTAGGEVVTAARVHREALIAADAVLLVLGARDLHLQAGLAQLDLLLVDLEIPAERLRVLINGVGGPGTGQEKALTQALAPKLAERGLTADAWLAWDARALHRTARTGIPLAAARPRGAYARALGRLLDELFLPDSTRTRQRKLKLSVPTMTRTRGANDPTDEEVALPWQS
jgi:Flp pilus assembly CpaE family ATPase